MKRAGKTKPFRDRRGRVLANSIAETGYLCLGGVAQWVMLRGENRNNPPLILLYGGPGFAETPLFRYFNAELEKTYTVVYWEQRGSGKSYNRKVPRSSLTLEQFVADLDELIAAVWKRLGKQKVVLYGHSWGSVLGLAYAARFPEKVAAYVGSGQVGDWKKAESASYAFALAEARRRQNTKALKQLLKIGPPPYDAKSLWTERLWLNRLEGNLRPRKLWEMIRVFSRRPEYSVFSFPRIMRNFRKSFFAMWPAITSIDLTALVPAVKVPAFFFLGRNDHWVPPETSEVYIQQLKAPEKTLLWFERSGHEPFADEPAKFNAAMAQVARYARQDELR